MAAVTMCSDFGAKKIKSVTVSIVSPSICHKVMGPDAIILVFWMLNFKPTFSLTSFISSRGSWWIAQKQLLPLNSRLSLSFLIYEGQVQPFPCDKIIYLPARVTVLSHFLSTCTTSDGATCPCISQGTARFEWADLSKTLSTTQM